jgi:hypothetical protein
MPDNPQNLINGGITSQAVITLTAYGDGQHIIMLHGDGTALSCCSQLAQMLQSAIDLAGARIQLAQPPLRYADTSQPPFAQPQQTPIVEHPPVQMTEPSPEPVPVPPAERDSNLPNPPRERKPNPMDPPAPQVDGPFPDAVGAVNRAFNQEHPGRRQ